MAATLPRRVVEPAAAGLGRLYGSASRADASAVRENLKAALPGCTDQGLSALTLEVFENYSAYLVDLFYALEGAEAFRRRLECSGLHRLDRALAGGRGVVAVSAHVGHWERAGMALALSGYRLKALAVRHRDPSVERFFERRRSAYGVGIVHLDGSLRECYRHLSAGGVLGVNADRLYGEGGHPVEFLGRTVGFPQGPARIAARCGAPLLPVFMIMAPEGRLRLEVGEELPSDDPARTTAAYARCLERVVRTHPTQWFLFQRYWEAPQWPD
ncbi:MAG: Lipid A biosynthesis lauroyltransferase [Candidatus Omnitrophica bacterium]|nr:Lipid A biosynthesis lauroyltransferase [Candidatus Omnitrophota bacterium]